MASGNVSGRLARAIDGSRSGSESVEVRYTGFSEGKNESNTWSKAPTRQTKGVVGPSGSLYNFRQHGSGTNSQWLDVHEPEDVDYFEEAEEYEVRRE